LLSGSVSAWHDEDGWGVIRLADGREVWAWYSSIDAPDTSRRTLASGMAAVVEVEEAQQDGYSLRATYIRVR